MRPLPLLALPCWMVVLPSGISGQPRLTVCLHLPSAAPTVSLHRRVHPGFTQQDKEQERGVPRLVSPAPLHCNVLFIPCLINVLHLAEAFNPTGLAVNGGTRRKGTGRGWGVLLREAVLLHLCIRLIFSTRQKNYYFFKIKAGKALQPCRGFIYSSISTCDSPRKAIHWMLFLHASQHWCSLAWNLNHNNNNNNN